MRRFWQLSLFLIMLILPVRAEASVHTAALVIDSGANGEYTNRLLDGLYDRGLHATFLLQGSYVQQNPELVQRIVEEGHEIACKGFSGKSMAHMSRRTIAQELLEFRALLPEGCGMKFLYPPGGISDGVRQVAEVRQLALLGWSVSADVSQTAVQDGDIVHLQDASEQSVQQALALLDVLMEKDFDLCTVSALAKGKNVSIRPGKIYKEFYP